MLFAYMQICIQQHVPLAHRENIKCPEIQFQFTEHTISTIKFHTIRILFNNKKFTLAPLTFFFPSIK